MRLQHARFSIYFSSNSPCRFHASDSSSTTMYGSQLLCSVKFQELAFWLSHLLCSPITGSTKHLSHSSIHMTTFRKGLKQSVERMHDDWSEKKLEEGRRGRKPSSGMKISLKTVSIKSMPTGNRVRKNQVHFLTK